MLDSRRPQISEKLSDMFIRQCLARLDHHDQPAINEQISEVVAKNGSIFVAHLQRMLRQNSQAEFTQPIQEALLVNLFQVTAAQKVMKSEPGFPDYIAQGVDVISHSSLLLDLQGNSLPRKNAK